MLKIVKEILCIVVLVIAFISLGLFFQNKINNQSIDEKKLDSICKVVSRLQNNVDTIKIDVKNIDNKVDTLILGQKEIIQTIKRTSQEEKSILDKILTWFE